MCGRGEICRNDHMEVVRRIWQNNVNINLKLIRECGEVWIVWLGIAAGGVLSLERSFGLG